MNRIGKGSGRQGCTPKLANLAFVKTQAARALVAKVQGLPPV